MESDDSRLSLQEDPTAVLQQLERILTSRHFRNSRKYPAFLRFVVETKLSDDTDLLKERTLGIEVFNRPIDYDTNSDPVVRVTAGEVRKRLAQYYQESAPEDGIEIFLPVGSYIPQFKMPQEAKAVDAIQERQHSSDAGEIAERLEAISATPENPGLDTSSSGPARTFSLRSHFVYGVLLLSCLMMIGILALRLNRIQPKGPDATNTLDLLWQPLLNGSSTLTLYVGAFDAPGIGPVEDLNKLGIADRRNKAQLVPASTSFAGMAVFNYLTKHNRDFAVRTGRRATFSEFQNGPSVILGLADDFWVRKYSENLRFHFSSNDSGIVSIEDREKPGHPIAVVNVGLPYGEASADYAIVGRIREPDSNQWVFFAAGIGEAGMYAAGRYLRNPRYSEALLHDARTKWGSNKNVEIILSSNVIHGVSGPPQIVAACDW